MSRNCRPGVEYSVFQFGIELSETTPAMEIGHVNYIGCLSTPAATNEPGVFAP